MLEYLEHRKGNADADLSFIETINEADWEAIVRTFDLHAFMYSDWLPQVPMDKTKKDRFPWIDEPVSPFFGLF